MGDTKKNNKYFTLILVPHAEGEARNYKIPMWLCQAACIVIVLFFAALFALTYYYRDLKSTAEENIYLKEEIKDKSVELNEVTRDTERLSAKSDEIEEQINNVADILGVEPPGIGEDDKIDGLP